MTIGANASNTRLHVSGTLEYRDDEDMGLIDPRPGRVEVFRVGGAQLVLLEGDLVEVEFEEAQVTTTHDGTRISLPAIATADFGAVQILLDHVPERPRNPWKPSAKQLATLRAALEIPGVPPLGVVGSDAPAALVGWHGDDEVVIKQGEMAVATRAGGLAAIARHQLEPLPREASLRELTGTVAGEDVRFQCARLGEKWSAVCANATLTIVVNGTGAIPERLDLEPLDPDGVTF